MLPGSLRPGLTGWRAFTLVYNRIFFNSYLELHPVIGFVVTVFLHIRSRQTTLDKKKREIILKVYLKGHSLIWRYVKLCTLQMFMVNDRIATTFLLLEIISGLPLNTLLSIRPVL